MNELVIIYCKPFSGQSNGLWFAGEGPGPRVLGRWPEWTTDRAFAKPVHRSWAIERYSAFVGDNKYELLPATGAIIIEVRY